MNSIRLMLSFLLLGTILWCIGAFATTWVLGAMAWIFDYVLGGYKRHGFSPVDAWIHFLSLFIQNMILAIPFLFAFVLEWGILRYWYVGGVASAFYLWIGSKRGKLPLIFLGFLVAVQMIIIALLGYPIRYRSLEFYELIWLYCIPTVRGALSVYGYHKFRSAGRVE